MSRGLLFYWTEFRAPCKGNVPHTYSYFCRIDKVVWRKDDLKLDIKVALVSRPLVDGHSLAIHTAYWFYRNTAHTMP